MRIAFQLEAGLAVLGNCDGRIEAFYDFSKAAAVVFHGAVMGNALGVVAGFTDGEDLVSAEVEPWLLDEAGALEQRLLGIRYCIIKESWGWDGHSRVWVRTVGDELGTYMGLKGALGGVCTESGAVNVAAFRWGKMRAVLAVVAAPFS
eukprot:6304157-Ditylum_brightwellii.AAC.1